MYICINISVKHANSQRECCWEGILQSSCDLFGHNRSHRLLKPRQSEQNWHCFQRWCQRQCCELHRFYEPTTNHYPPHLLFLSLPPLRLPLPITHPCLLVYSLHTHAPLLHSIHPTLLQNLSVNSLIVMENRSCYVFSNKIIITTTYEN